MNDGGLPGTGMMGASMGPADMAAVMRGGYGYNNDSWGSGSCWWIVVLFFAMMMFGGGFGNNNFQNAIGYQNLATSNEVQRGFDNQNSMANERDILASISNNALQGMQNANQNNQYLAGLVTDKYNELQRDINGINMMQQQAMANQNECCCSTKMLIQDNTATINAGLAQNRYESAMNVAAINAGIAQNRYDAALNTAAITQAIQQEAAQNRMVAQQEGAATRQLMQDNKIEALQQRVNDLNLQVQMAGVARVPMTATYNAGPYPFCIGNNGFTI